MSWIGCVIAVKADDTGFLHNNISFRSKSYFFSCLPGIYHPLGPEGDPSIKTWGLEASGAQLRIPAPERPCNVVLQIIPSSSSKLDRWRDKKASHQKQS